MKFSEIIERSDGELVTLERQLREDLFKLRVQKTTNQLEDTNAVRRAKVDLARVLTTIKAREKGITSSKS